MNHKTVFVTSLILVLTMRAVASAASINLSPAADAFVDSSTTTVNSIARADTNYGGAGALAVSADLGKGIFNSYMRFDTSTAVSSFDTQFGAGNWTIQSAVLQITASSPNNAIFTGNGAGAGNTNINFAGNLAIGWISDDSWVEGAGMPNNSPSTTGVTYNTQPTSTAESLATYAFDGATSGVKSITLTLSANALADITAGNLMSFRLSPGDSSIGFVFNSQNFTTSSARPILTLTAVPEPTLAGVVGLAMLFGRRRRRS